MTGAHVTEEQADEFAIGAMEPEIAAIVAFHVDACLACRAIVAESRRVTAGLALNVRRAQPPRSLRGRVLRETGISRPGPFTWAARIATAGAGLAAVAVAVAAFTGMVSVRSQVQALRQENVGLQTQINDALAQDVAIKAVTRRLTDAERLSSEILADAKNDRALLLAILSPESEIAEVFAVDESSAIGRFVWDREQQRIWFVATGLPARPEGQTYQLWVNTGGRYVSLGTFNTDQSGFVRYQTWAPPTIKSSENAVVTIETAGGVQERSGPSVFVADLSGFR